MTHPLPTIPRTWVHRVPGGYIVDLDDHPPGALGCVFARDLDEAIARLDLMREALVLAQRQDT